ncbi:unnamed protein product (macronuclear) [Paramecium tetraurelia]|uniref:SUN domain-containing protein n=1 Tax=Paramecium tetraurelia TaxID=5888 RepID=A0C378_PARTE|nr:uncharacterized protein GSPATT00034723001 [Paramecium tetraurelia]CAK65245.1 unnamed protein product [Paramecium tetraurelia]|eukprot:XP_001432642.1 hypothetical protein (macronuclear) [Paramecium tetraurelia strain d4-2]
MGDELILKIVEVNPPSSESGSKNIIKATGEWYTRDKEAKIVIDFGNALISLISIQNYHADQVNIRLKGENSDEIYYDKVIWKKNDEWNKLQSVDIEPFSQEIYNQMIVEVLNYTQKDYKGLKRIRVYGEQDKAVYNERKKIRKQQKKEQKNKEKASKETQNQEKSDQKDLAKKTKIDESSTKKNENWEKYKKPQNQQNKEPIFIDTREKLKNIHKGLSPIKEETEQFDQKAVQTPKQPEVFEKLGINVNERKMIRFNFNQIDKQFLELHQELQQTSGIGKDRQLNYANFETHWLQ